MKAQSQIIRNKIKSLYVQALIARKGWSEQHAAYLLVEYITCGKSISLAEFLEAQK